MTVDADFAVTVQIVQSNELLSQRVLVGSHVAAENSQSRIAIAFGKIAEYLVVGAVLFDDVNNMLNGRAGADFARNDGGRSRRPGFCQQRIVVGSVGDYRFGVSGNLRLQIVQGKKFDTSLL